MATTEELEKEILAEMAADPVAYTAGPVDDVITIDGETRVISVPASEILFGVETDKDVERKHFRCPKIVGDGIDLSKHQIYISYITSDSTGKSFSGDSNLYLCEDVAVDGDDITFSWQLSGNVFASAGFIAFKVLAAKTDGENVQTRWNTVPAVGTVLMTVPDGMDISETYPDIVTQLLERMASVEKIATEEAMQGYVNTYLEAHPADIDETLTNPKKAAPADVVGKLKEDLNVISDERNYIPIKLSFSDNVGKYINTNGTISTNKLFSISDLIPIELGNKKMRITFKRANPNIARCAFLKKNVLSNDNVISFFANGDSGTFDIEIPEGAKYVVANSDTDSRGLTENGYPKARFFPSSANVDELAESVNALDTKVSEISEKLADSVVETVIEPIYEKYLGKYVNPNGKISTNSAYDTSDPIRIDESVNRIKVEVDAGNKYISRITFLSSDSLAESNIIWNSIDTAKPVAEYEVPSGAKYFCIAKDVDERGNAHDDYPHVITVSTKKSEISDLRDKIAGIERSNRKPVLNIGSKIYAVVGDTLQIFKKSIVDSFGIPYIMKIESAKGRAYPRYWEYTPNANDVGSSEIKFSLLNVDGSAIDERIVSLITVNASNTSKNVLNIGDSTMANGEIPIEVSRRIKGTNGVETTPTALALSNINVVGRIKNGDRTVGWEGTGGWSYTNYTSKGSRAVRFQVTNAQSITVKDLIRIGATNSYGYYQFEVTEVNVTNGTGNIRAVFSYTTPYSSNFLNEISASGNLTNANNSVVGSYLSFTEEFYQPFWNSTTNQFDIKTYVNDYCGNKVDYIFILLGINSLYGTKPFASVDSVLNSCKNLLRKIHTDLPNTKILLSTNNLISQNGGLGFNYNAQTYFGQYDVTAINHLIFDMNKAYYTLETDTEFMQYVEIVNTHAQFDADNAFPTIIKNVNTRSGETESVGTNGVHPTNNGYWQIADAEFRALLAN